MKIVNEDILTVTSGVIAHGVNCQRAMGSGVAKVLYTKYPEVREVYMQGGKGDLGSVTIVPINSELTIVNCYTQEFYGYDGKRYASPEALKGCMFILSEMYEEVHLPAIGCGLAGLELKELKEILLKIEERKGKDVFILHLLGE